MEDTRGLGLDGWMDRGELDAIFVMEDELMIMIDVNEMRYTVVNWKMWCDFGLVNEREINERVIGYK